MNDTPEHPFAERLRNVPDSCLLYADRATGAELMSVPDVAEHTEHYIAIEHGDSAHRGMLTGALGGFGGLFFSVLALIAYWRGDSQEALACLLIALPAFIIPFLWEVLRPMPLPILLNRRTRELYYEQDGALYHSPWDGIAAAAYQFGTVGPYTGGMRHAALEVLLQRHGQPEERVLLNLGMPIGKSLEMQQGFWEYLRAYMDHGPWFDEQGRHSESPELNRSLLIDPRGQSLYLQWGLLVEEYKANNGRNFLSYSRFMLVFLSLLFFPIFAVQNFTYAMAQRRSRLGWPELVAARLRPDGPTTRLIDLERERDLA